MAFANYKSLSLLLILALSCLMMISAEEEVPSVDETTTGNRQSKQIFLVPQLSPASTYPASYLSGSPYEQLPLMMMPQQSPLIQRYPVRKQQQLASSNWPYNYPLLSSPAELKDDREEEDEDIPAAWRVHDGIDDFDHLKWWKRRFNRQAVITIIPAATECVSANVAADGFGPCKRATQAPHGTIEIRLVGPDPQTAVIAITANSPVNTRIRLICTDITSAGVFTQTGQIATVADTPRTEVGFMHLVVTSTAANAVVKCSWISYRHYTATYP